MTELTVSALVPDCETCDDYFRHRNVAVLVRGVLDTAEREGVPSGVIVSRFANGLHARHLAGKSIAVDTVNRLGQIEPAELLRNVGLGEITEAHDVTAVPRLDGTYSHLCRKCGAYSVGNAPELPCAGAA